VRRRAPTSSIVLRNAGRRLSALGHSAARRAAFWATLRGQAENGPFRASSSSGGQSGRQKPGVASRCALVKGVPDASTPTSRACRLLAGRINAGTLVALRWAPGAGRAWQAMRSAMTTCAPRAPISALAWHLARRAAQPALAA